MSDGGVHIVNGDSAVHLLRAAGIEEDIIVWREMLCDGPCSGHPGQESFWQDRIRYFQTLGVSESDYVEQSKKEIERIPAIHDDAKIHLWFEWDLFCFVNFCCLVDYLKELGRTTALTLHCPKGRNAQGGYLTLADHRPEEILDIDQRTLELEDIGAASHWWKAYTAGDDATLREVSFRHAGFMPLAYAAHHSRMPLEGNSLIEAEILTFLSEGPVPLKDLIRHLLYWQKEHHFGFGDLQFITRIERLSGIYIIMENDMVSLSGEDGRLPPMQFGGFTSA